MNSYAFFTDSDSDLPFRFVDELELNMVYMPYMVDGKEYFDDLGRNGREKEFFDAMRKGAAPVTSLLPTAAYEEYFEPVFAAGRDILFVAFSSQLSGTINNVYAARDELLAKYPDRRMTVVDTLSISAPQTILILKAHELYRQGKSMDEVAQWLEENKLRAQAWFTVDDLKYLRRGGRIPSGLAKVGDLLSIKPVVAVNDGAVAPIGKARGRHAGEKRLRQEFENHPFDPAWQITFVYSLGTEIVEDFASDFCKKYGIDRAATRDVQIGPTIGAHLGPDCVGLAFVTKDPVE